jgi:hypothetical protein
MIYIDLSDYDWVNMRFQWENYYCIAIPPRRALCHAILRQWRQLPGDLVFDRRGALLDGATGDGRGTAPSASGTRAPPRLLYRRGRHLIGAILVPLPILSQRC